MNFSLISRIILVVGIATTSGCATYRTSSNIDSETAPAVVSNTPVLISEGPITDRKYEEIGPIEVSIKKLTVFHDDPTVEQANKALIDKARIIGAEAVINVSYKSGIGFTTWGYIDAKGTGVRFTD